MKVCLRLGAQGATHADGKGQEPQARRTRVQSQQGFNLREPTYLLEASRRSFDKDQLY